MDFVSRINCNGEVKEVHRVTPWVDFPLKVKAVEFTLEVLPSKVVVGGVSKVAPDGKNIIKMAKISSIYLL